VFFAGAAYKKKHPTPLLFEIILSDVDMKLVSRV
jgi:hypothetical protein